MRGRWSVVEELILGMCLWSRWMYTGRAVLTVATEGIKWLFGMFWKDLQLFVHYVRIGSLITLSLFVLLFLHRFNFPHGGGISFMYTCVLWLSMHIYPCTYTKVGFCLKCKNCCQMQYIENEEKICQCPLSLHYFRAATADTDFAGMLMSNYFAVKVTVRLSVFTMLTQFKCIV